MSSALIGDAFAIMPNGNVVELMQTQLTALNRQPVVAFKQYATNPDVTHLEFALVRGFEARRTANGGRGVARPVYVYLRAVKRVGPPIDDKWERVPLVK